MLKTQMSILFFGEAILKPDKMLFVV